MTKWAAILSLLAISATTIASDIERERRWVTEVADSVMTGDVEFLDADGHEFMVLYTEADDEAKGAVIVVHGIGVHPNWPDVIYPLRTRLPQHGWATLSIQMPVLAADAEGKDYFAVQNEVSPRMEAALAYLKERGFDNAIVVAHSLGTMMVSHWLANEQPAAITAFAGIGMTTASGGPSDNVPAYLARIDLPILDLYGSADLAGVIEQAPARAASGAKTAASFTQQVTDGATHFYQGHEDDLLDAVVTWIESL